MARQLSQLSSQPFKVQPSQLFTKSLLRQGWQPVAKQCEDLLVGSKGDTKCFMNLAKTTDEKHVRSMALTVV